MGRFSHRSITAAAVALLLVAAVSTPARAQTGKTLTPDLLTYLVSDIIFGERWTIGLNVAPEDESTIINLTGNILRGAGDVLFVHCLPRPGSTKFTRQPGLLLTFDCKLMGACEDDALGCAKFEWQILTGEGGFAPCESFFLPGNGACGTSSSAGAEALAHAASAVVEPPLAFAPPLGVDDADDAVARVVEVETVQGGLGPARTLTEDGFNHLVTFDLFGARWSVSLNLFPLTADSGALVKVLGSMTGNLFFTDGREPLFVHCDVRDDSNGRLEDPSSVFRFDCSSAVNCATDPVACAQSSWSTLAVDVRLAGSTFLPPDGLGLPPGSDPGIVVLPPVEGPGTPPGVAVSTSQGNAGALRLLGPAGGGCNVGSGCGMRVGSCAEERGVIELLPQGCFCSVRRIRDGCIQCRGGESLGLPCNFPVASGLNARGVCLPTSYLGTTNACFAIPFDGSDDIVRCGGPLGAGCPRGGCCADDPRDGCVPSAINGNCVGICVDTEDCDPERRICGICAPFQSQGGVNQTSSPSSLPGLAGVR